MSLTLTDAQADRARALLDELHVLFADRVLAPPAPPAAAPPATPAEPPRLTEADFVDAARLIGCDVPAIRAAAEVEANGKGFAPDGRPMILFEPHVFSRLTDHRFDSTHGGVSYPKWGGKPYPKTQKERWDQLLYAARLDHDAAYQAASWGLFQIMGFNFKICGFLSIDAFVEAMRAGEREHLLAFVGFVLGNSLGDELREHRWAEFAARYNGPGYRANAYDLKLAAAHDKWSALA